MASKSNGNAAARGVSLGPYLATVAQQLATHGHEKDPDAPLVAVVALDMALASLLATFERALAAEQWTAFQERRRAIGEQIEATRELMRVMPADAVRAALLPTKGGQS